MKSNGKKVFVGISGGVDSSVSAALLKEQGYEVVGVFIKTWTPDFLECTSRDDRRDAMRVCAELQIPFLLCDGEEAYKKQVVDYMIDEYAKGRTPNPDVMCNKYVKFGVFYDFAMRNGADFVATGHYARVQDGRLSRGVDEEKDQSYFLWQIPKEKLLKTIFPIGNLEKAKVRALAKKFKLFTSNKKDSQGLCFMGKLDVKEFLKEMLKQNNTEAVTGKVLDTAGQVIGEHEGAMLYTIGERRGFVLHKQSPDNTPLYVKSKDLEANTITVGPKEVQVSNITQIVLESENILNSKDWENPEGISMQYRYHGEKVPVTVEKCDSRYLINLNKSLADIALGQSAVLYHGDECLGGGIIGGLLEH